VDREDGEAIFPPQTVQPHRASSGSVDVPSSAHLTAAAGSTESPCGHRPTCATTSEDSPPTAAIMERTEFGYLAGSGGARRRWLRHSWIESKDRDAGSVYRWGKVMFSSLRGVRQDLISNTGPAFKLSRFWILLVSKHVHPPSINHLLRQTPKSFDPSAPFVLDHEI
jgi:hypothetical protein